MKPTKFLLAVLLILITVTFTACTRQWCCTDFESMPYTPDTLFNHLNTNIATACGFKVDNTSFTTAAGNVIFGFAKVENAPAGFGSGHVLRLNNSTFLYNGIAGATGKIKFEYLDLGGVQNLSINGVLFVGKLLAAVSSPILSPTGVVVSVTSFPITPPASGVKGVVTLSGQIKSFGIGGQEFYIDNLCSK